MKYLLLLLIFVPIACLSQTDSLKNLNVVDTVYKVSVIGSSLPRSLQQSAFESYFTSLADSISNSSTTNELPVFLKDPNFDNNSSFFWLQGDNSVSLRDIILSRVNSCFCLKLIISDKSGIYRKKPLQVNNLKYNRFSFYDLALQRIQKLACNK